MYGAYAGGSLVGTAADFAIRSSIPGGELAAAGVTMVGVVPSHRRQGIAYTSHAAAADGRSQPRRAAGHPLGLGGAIYGRYGFGVATRVVGIDADRASIVFDAPDPEAQVRMVDFEEAARVFPAIYERVRRETPGAIVRSDDWWKLYRLPDREWHRRGAGPKFHALLELDGEPAGYASYRVKGDWEEGFAAVPAARHRPRRDLAARSPRALALPVRRRSRPARRGVAASAGSPVAPAARGSRGSCA